MARSYALSERTAHRLQQMLADGGTVGRPATSAPAARGVTWVKVTGPADGGWYPGVVSLDVAGEFEDLDAEVLVAAAGSAELVEDERYLCTRTGDAEEGVARFRAVIAGSGGGSGGTVPVRGYLTALSGGKWKWKPVSLNASGAFTLGTETATFNATELAPPYSAEAWAAAAVGTIVDMYRTTDATGGAEQWVFLSLALANDDPGNPGGGDARGGLLSSEYQCIPGLKFFTEGVGGHTVNGQGYGDADEDNWADDPAFLWQGPSGTFVQSGLITDPFGYYGSTCIRFGYVTGPTIATYGGPAVDIGIGDFFNFTPGPYVRAGHFQIRVNANTVHTGAFGTLGDGSTVEGGIITAIVGGGTVIDGGAL